MNLSDEQLQRYQPCLDYIDHYWDRITRHQMADEGTLIGLPRPFVCANHNMFRELYYWDSYFIILGLEHTPREPLVADITENIFHLFNRFGRIPNASRYYYLSRSQPPFLTSMLRKALAVKLRRGVPESEIRPWLKTNFELAKREYNEVWRGKKFPDHREVYRGLSRFYDLNIWHQAAEAESGWDMTSRFEDRCLDFIPIDLNCLLYQYERDFIAIASRLDDPEEAGRWSKVMEERRQAVIEVLWDEDTGFFYDYDYKRGRRSTFRTVAAFFALWSELATREQAARMVELHLPSFNTGHGIVTTERWEYEKVEISRQWAWPNGWAPLQWIAISGLVKYGYHEQAQRIARNWVDLVTEVFDVNLVNFEKYDVVHGKRAVPDRYPDQAGFAWTNAVYRRLVDFLRTGKLWRDYAERMF